MCRVRLKAVDLGQEFSYNDKTYVKIRPENFGMPDLDHFSCV